jgi:hypothetical protein
MGLTSKELPEQLTNQLRPQRRTQPTQPKTTITPEVAQQFTLAPPAAPQRINQVSPQPTSHLRHSKQET